MKKRSFKVTLFTYGVVFFMASVAFLVRWLSGRFDQEFNIILFFVSFLVISIIWESLRLLHQQLNILFPFERSIPARIAIQLFIGVAIAVTIRYGLYKFGEPYLPIQFDIMFLASTWAIFVITVSGINSIFFIEFFVDRWKDSLVQSERLEKEKAQIQFENLRNQLNPHFLFNALTSLNSLITENAVLASEFLQHMSKVYRYVLQNKDKNSVSLQTELDFIRNYIFLVETRFGGALKVEFQIETGTLESAIVPVTLQILIENALKHNVVDIDRPLTIKIFSSDDYLLVSNNLQRRNTVETSNRQGLNNLRSLYRFMTDRPVLIDNGDSKFTVKVPLL